MTLYKNALEVGEAQIHRAQAERQLLLRKEIESFLRGRLEAYPERRKALWKLDTSSEAAYLKSVAPNRELWKQVVAPFDFSGSPVPKVDLDPFFEDDQVLARWVRLPLEGTMRAYAVYAVPKKAKGKRPLVVCQHGVGSNAKNISGPERVFGFGEHEGMYGGLARELAEAGFAVLAPLNVTEGGEPRGRLHRLCEILGHSLIGLEVGKLSRLLDWAQTQAEVDGARMGMCGLSLGGTYTLVTLPLELRLKCGVCSAFFNQRVRKMAFDDRLCGSFLSGDSEYMFLRGWLERHSDSELCALICPRPFLIQQGKADNVSWWPDMEAEYQRAREPYDALGIGERIGLDMHEGGHEFRVEEAIAFFKKWLGLD